MINQLVSNANNKESYLHQFETAQHNFALVCEEYKGTKLCKKQHLRRARYSHQHTRSSIQH